MHKKQAEIIICFEKELRKRGEIVPKVECMHVFFGTNANAKATELRKNEERIIFKFSDYNKWELNAMQLVCAGSETHLAYSKAKQKK